MVLPVKSRRCDVLATRGLLTMVIPPEQVGDVTDYDAMVLGSAVYTGHWLEPAKELVRRSGDGFAGRPVWLFSSGPVGDPTRELVQKMRADPVRPTNPTISSRNCAPWRMARRPPSLITQTSITASMPFT